MITNNRGIEVIFDLDGTLIDSTGKLNQDVVEAMERLGVYLTCEQVHKKNWKKLSAEQGVSYKAFMKEFSRRKTWEESLKAGEISIFPESIAVLDYLKNQGAKMSLLTRSIPEYTEQKLNHFPELRKYFDMVETVHPDVKTKVNTAEMMIQRILRERNVDRAYFVGDRIEDLEPVGAIERNYGIESKGIWIMRGGLANLTTPYKTSASGSLEAVPRIIGE